MSNNRGDPTAAIAGVVLLLVFIYLLFVIGVIILASMAVFVIGWYLTHLVISAADRASGGQLLAEHSGLLLILSSAAWALLIWLLTPQAWVLAVATVWPAAGSPFLTPIVGAILGLAWGLLVTFSPDQDPEPHALDLSGMYSITDSEWTGDGADVDQLLAEGIILGLDVE